MKQNAACCVLGFDLLIDMETVVGCTDAPRSDKQKLHRYGDRVWRKKPPSNGSLSAVGGIRCSDGTIREEFAKYPRYRAGRGEAGLVDG